MGSLDTSASLITGIAHINLTIPRDTLHLANEFYGTTLGLSPRAVPHLQKGELAWFDVADSGQQVHIAFGAPSDFEKPSRRHPCFRLSSPTALLELRRRIWAHFERGGDAAPREADKPGEVDSGELSLAGLPLHTPFTLIPRSVCARCVVCAEAGSSTSRCVAPKAINRGLTVSFCLTRLPGRGIPGAVLCQGLRWEQARV
jgi:hypothetical protein